MIIYILFFITGISGLVYQVLWARMFGLVFGNTIFASSTVLGAYMAGLALGSYIAGKIIARRRDGLRIYAVLELGIGLFGAFMPFIVRGIPGIYGPIYRALSPSFPFLTGIRSFISFLVLIVPCLLIGATLPVISKYVTDNWQSRKGIVAKLYGINTLGAVIGCFSSGFMAIRYLGITITSLAAASLNIAVAVIAGLLYTKRKKVTIPKPQNAEQPAGGRSAGNSRIFLIAYGMAGFAALALEVGWIRSMVWIIGLDSYAFAAMLSVVLAGIGLGSFIISFFIDRIERNIPTLYGIHFFLGIFVFLSIIAIHNAHDLIRGILSIVNRSPFVRFIFINLGAYTVIQIIIASLILLIPALLMGAAFPLFVRVYIRRSGNVGQGVGSIYAVNTMGGIFGSIAMGFLIIPIFGLLPSIAAMGIIYFGVALVLLFLSKGERAVVRRLKGSVIIGVTLLLLFTVNFDFTNILSKTLKTAGEYTFEKVLYFREHATGAIMVKESEIYGREMLIDGIQVASSGDFDLHSHIYPAHLMSLLKENPKDVLIVAFGCGGTSGSLLLYDDVDLLDAVEICNGVVEPAIQFFSEMNSDVFQNEKLNLIIQDGKNYVGMTEKSYDIIYSGPIHPQSNQASAALYTIEYFEDCKKSLKADGFQCLWLPLHVTAPDYFKILVKTFMEVYPHVTLWQLPHTPNSASHPHLIGSQEEIYPDYEVINRKLARPGIREDLNRLHDTRFQEPYEFIAQLVLGEQQLREMVADVRVLNTDNLPVVEFYDHSVDLVADSKKSKAVLLGEIAKRMEHPLKYVQNVPAGEREQLKRQLDRLYEGYKNLMLGHSLIAISEFSGADVEKFIRQYYEKAREYLPESTYLQKYLSR